MTVATAPEQVIPTVGWDEFKAHIWRYWPGQHVTMIGPTGWGKSTLGLSLMPHNMYPVVFRTKREDETLDRYTKGFTVMRRWEAYDPDVATRIVLWPPLNKGLRSREDQRDRFREALEGIFRTGHYLTYLDELRYITDFLGLKDDVELLLMQGRSMGAGVWSSVQRPRHVPLLAYDQAGHIFLWGSKDIQSEDRVSDLGGAFIPGELIEYGLQNLRKYEVLHLDTDRGTITKTKVAV